MAQVLHMNAEVTSTSLPQSYDTLMTLKADQTIRTSDNLNNLILSIINPLLNIHSRITASYSDHQSSFTFTEVDPIDTVNEGLDQLLSILNLLDNDFIRPTHKLSKSLKSLRHRLDSLEETSKISSTQTETKSIRQISKQSLCLVKRLMNQTRVIRQVLKDFICWADTELMASLASSKPILQSTYQDSNPQETHHDQEMQIDEEFYNLIDQCVDIIQSTYQLNLFLRKLQHQFHELIPTLGSLTNLLIINHKRSLQLNLIRNHQIDKNRHQKDKRLDSRFVRVSSNLVCKFLKSIDPTCLVTVHRLMKRLESSLDQRR
ncbi:uncharacterized protein MELLADRAFT_62984 [Melampsora larici-populina 98AG31]|uniref:Uncharacterized protein n=1 Tax=Melampsora larici-populina (strain 98AG31 / pathotype 3-4-7) TaxID=747676 RepID=F4RKV1_MELLP|nr:uncharacterized protein MELLADRAFT_62984 [Melampsora larici-populina 98AG31]EGG06789.1 hypothetical protein MELLADRAFT_62984 [Melampsora larici-populina 98AG31]